MSIFTITDLEAIASEVLDNSRLKLSPELDATAAPGWDSLQHTLIVLEINERFGISLEPTRAAEAKNFGQLIDEVNQLIAAKS